MFAILAALVLSLCSCSLFDPFSRMTPKEKLRYAFQNTLDIKDGSASESLSEIKTVLGSVYGGKTVIKAVPGYLIDIPGLDEAKLSFDLVRSENDSAKADISVFTNGSEIVSGTVYISDLKDPAKKLILELPGLVEDPLVITNETEQEEPISIPDLKSACELIEKLLPVLADKTYDGLPEATESSETKEIEIGGIVQSATVIDMNISYNDLFDIGTVLIDELKSNEDLKKYIEDNYELFRSDDPDNQTAEEIYNGIMDDLSELRESFGKEKEQYGSDEALDLRVWIDASRKITGIKVNIIKESVQIIAGKASGEGKTAFALNSISHGTLLFSADGNFTSSGSTIAGNAVLKTGTQEILRITFEDVDSNKLHQGVITGKYAIDTLKMINDELESIGLGQITVNAVFSSDNTDRNTSFDISAVSGGKELISVSVKSDLYDTAGTVEIPEGKSEDIMEWLSSVDIYTIIDRLKESGVSVDPMIS